jgi:hypothetical protein
MANWKIVLEKTDDSAARVAWSESEAAARDLAPRLARSYRQPIKSRFIDPRDGDDWTAYPNGACDRVIGRD